MKYLVSAVLTIPLAFALMGAWNHVSLFRAPPMDFEQAWWIVLGIAVAGMAWRLDEWKLDE